IFFFFCLLPPRFPLFPYTTLFRSPFLFFPHRDGFLLQFFHFFYYLILSFLSGRYFINIFHPLDIILCRLRKMLILKELSSLLFHLLEREPFLLQLLAPFFQTAHPLSHARLPDICLLRIMIRINILQPDSLIQNAVRSDSDLLSAQFFHTGAFHHTAQRKIHIRPDIIFLRRHFFRKGAFPSPVGHPAVLKYFFSTLLVSNTAALKFFF